MMNSTTNTTTATRQRRAAIAVALCICMALPFPVYANHGLEAIGGFIKIFTVVLVLLSANFFMAIGNITWHSPRIRTVNIILTIPLILLTVAALFFGIRFSFFLILLACLQCFLIYKSASR